MQQPLKQAADAVTVCGTCIACNWSLPGAPNCHVLSSFAVGAALTQRLTCKPPLQGCWLFLLPTLLVALMDARARRDFALSLPTGTLPPAERAWWLALCLPPPCLAVLLGMPPLAMALWRFGALALEAARA